MFSKQTRRIIWIWIRLTRKLNDINGIIITDLCDIIIVTVFFEKSVTENFRDKEETLVNTDNLRQMIRTFCQKSIN